MTYEPGVDVVHAIVRLGDEVEASRLARRGALVNSADLVDNGRVLALEDAYFNLSLQLSEVALAFGDFELARACARRVYDRDPLNESACQLVLRAAGELGDLADVRSTYASHVEARREFLDNPPSPSIRSLFERLTAAT